MNGVQASVNISTHWTREELGAEFVMVCSEVETIIEAGISGLQQETPPFNGQSARQHSMDSVEPGHASSQLTMVDVL